MMEGQMTTGRQDPMHKSSLAAAGRPAAAFKNNCMQNYNGINFNWDGIEGGGLFGKSGSGFKSLFENNLPDNFKNLFPTPLLNNNSLHEYEWKTYWSNELRDTFFGGDQNKASGSDDPIEVTDETKIYDSLKPEIRAFLYTDKDRNNKFDKGDVYRFEIKVFISTDGAKLLRAWKGVTAKDNELLIFLENNEGDRASDAVFLARAGKKVTGHVAKYADNKNIKDWVNTVYKISGDELEKLLISTADKGWFVNMLRQIIKVYSRIASWPIEKVSELFSWIGLQIAGKLHISEERWKTGSDAAKLVREHQQKLATALKDIFKDWQDKKQRPGSQEQKSISVYEQLMQEAYNEAIEIIKLYPDIAPDMLWALICGILNGIIDLIAGLFSFIGLLLKLYAQGIKNSESIFDSSYYIHLMLEYTDNLAQAISKIKWKEVFEKAVAAYNRFIYIEAPQLLIAAGISVLTVDPREIAYFTGYIVFNIIICFIPIVDLIQLTQIGRLAKPIQELFEIILKQVNKTGRLAVEKLSDLFKLFEDFVELLNKGTEEVGNFIKRIFEAIKKWIEELVGIKKSEYDLDALGFNNKKVSGKGYLDGETLTRQEIEAWEELAVKFKARIVRKLKPRQLKLLIRNNARAGFNPFTGEIFVQKGFTKYEIFHEMKHAEECALIGKEAYTEGIFGSKTEQLLRTYKREKYVYDEIIKNQNLFSRPEIEHANWYINRIIKLLKKEGIDPLKII